MISASVLDDERNPKQAWRTVVDACRPVIVVCDPLPPELSADEPLELDVHVVNDLRESVDALVSVTRVLARRPSPVGLSRLVGADTCERVGTLEFTSPELPGELLLGIALNGRTRVGGGCHGHPPRRRPRHVSERSERTIRLVSERSATIDWLAELISRSRRGRIGRWRSRSCSAPTVPSLRRTLLRGARVVAPADRVVIATVVEPLDPTLVIGTGMAGGVMYAG